MFSANTDDLQFLFESAAQPVLVNDVPVNAIVTNPQMSENEERYIHTLDGVLQGDIVTLDDEKFLAISESVTPRHGKYKTKIRHCNFTIEMAGEIIQDFLRDENGEIIRDNYGRPIPIEIEGESHFIPAIVDNKSFNIVQGQIAVADNEIEITVQDNDVNRDKFEVNKAFNLMAKSWKVRNVDMTKRGLLVLTCEMVI